MIMKKSEKWKTIFKSKSLIYIVIAFAVAPVAINLGLVFTDIIYENTGNTLTAEYSCAMKSHFRKIENQMSGSGNHLCEFTRVMFYLDRIPLASICHVQYQCLDRLLHHSSVISIKGPSYRLKDKRAYLETQEAEA